MSRQTRQHGNRADVSIDEIIESFKEKLMHPFLTALMKFRLLCICMILRSKHLICSKRANSKREEKAIALFEFYDRPKTSNFQGDSNEAGALLSTDICDDEIRLFCYEDFDLEKNEAAEKRNRLILELIRKRELKAGDVETYKREHPLLLTEVYKAMSKNTHLYPDFMKHFKLSLLIPPSTANAERGFSVLIMLHTKYRNSLSPNSLDKLMRLVFLGATTLSDETWKGLVDRYDQRHERRIRLKR